VRSAGTFILAANIVYKQSVVKPLREYTLDTHNYVTWIS
jgi:hypothetical protein